jgi:hypothetical protein
MEAATLMATPPTLRRKLSADGSKKRPHNDWPFLPSMSCAQLQRVLGEGGLPATRQQVRHVLTKLLAQRVVNKDTTRRGRYVASACAKDAM